MEICRLCLTNLSEANKSDISYTLYGVIRKFFNIQMDKDDSLVPHDICMRCSTVLNDFNDFHTFVLERQEKLLDHIKKKLSGSKRESLRLEKLYDPQDSDDDEEMSDLMEISFTEEAVIEENRYEKYLCRICGRQLYNRDEYEIHQMYHEPRKIPNNTSICFICGKELRSDNNLTYHLKTHKEDPQKCIVCGNQYMNEYKLESHQLKSHMPHIFLVCQTCGRICRNKKALESHVFKVHKEKEKVKCLKCNIILKDLQSFRCHNRNKHNPNANRFSCKFCGKEFNKKLTWEDHEASHTGKTKYECEFCGRKFVSNPNYINHRMKVHPDEYAAWKQQQYSTIEVPNIID